MPARSPPAWIDPLVVAAGALAFFATTLRLDYAHRPLGDGWNRYLGNAISMAEGDWSGWLPWRGPGHAWVSLATLPLTDSLVRASQWVSLVAITSLFPLTWALGRALFGRFVALVGVVLLAAWPDLSFFAWNSSPYPLEAALLCGGALLGVQAVSGAGSDNRRAVIFHATGAGLLLGYAIATDLRGGTATLAICLGLACAGTAHGRRAVGVSLSIATTATLLAFLLYEILPVDLYSLPHQLALQRDHVAPLVPECVTRGSVSPTLADAVSPCGRALVRWNLDKAAAALPLSPIWFVALAGLAALPFSRAHLWRWATLSLPIATLLVSMPILALQHRYLLPLAPFAALLVAAGIGSIVTRIGGWAAPIALTITLALAVSWHALGPSLWTRERDTPRGAGAASLTSRGTVILAADRIRADARHPTIDCANANLRERLYPIPVASRSARACGDLARHPPSDATWLLTRATPLDPGWERVLGGETPGAVVLVRTGER